MTSTWARPDSLAALLWSSDCDGHNAHGMEPSLIRLRENAWQAMLDHVLASLPMEACGLLGGIGQEGCLASAVENMRRSAARFFMEPQEQHRAVCKLEDVGLQLVAIYHSHPHCPGKPSWRDLAEAIYLETPALIWFHEGGSWQCRASHLQIDAQGEIPIQIEA
jgi:proteasome lid subunit RPN8/RPN11